MMKIYFCCLCIVCQLGCSYEGLQRTPLGEFERQTFDSLGISVDIPKQSDKTPSEYRIQVFDSMAYQQNTFSKGVICINIHPFHPSSFGEPFYLINFKIVCFTEVQFEKFKLGLHQANDFLEFINFQDQLKSFQHNIIESFFREKHGNKVLYAFMKEQKLPNGDYIVAGATLLHESHNLNYESQDKESIKRILDSIKPI